MDHYGEAYEAEGRKHSKGLSALFRRGRGGRVNGKRAGLPRAGRLFSPTAVDPPLLPRRKKQRPEQSVFEAEADEPRDSPGAGALAARQGSRSHAASKWSLLPRRGSGTKGERRRGWAPPAA